MGGALRSLKVPCPTPAWSALLNRAHRLGQPFLYWRDPGSGHTLMGVGVCAEFAGDGIEALRAAHDWLEEHSAGSALDGAPSWFTATFDYGAGRDEWTAWRGLRLVVPQVLVEAREGVATAQLMGSDEGGLETARSLWDALVVGRRDKPPERAVQFEAPQWVETPAAFEARAARAIKRLGGALKKVVLANARRLPWRGDGIARTLDRMASSTRDGVHFACSQGAGSLWVGCTPETLVEQRDDDFRAHILAGTRTRQSDTSAAELLRSEKDRREHDLVAQGMIESLEPLAQQIVVPEEPSIRTLDHLLHLQRTLEGQTLPGVGFLELVAALHPTPALGGYPQAGAVADLERFEPLHRGAYGAPFGWIRGRRRGHAAVAIRSALLCEADATIFAGAGVVEHSVPVDEGAEVEAKMASIERELLGRTP